MEVTMLDDSDGDDVCSSSIEMRGLAHESARTSFKHRFKRILKTNNEESWWNAMEGVLKDDDDFAERVAVQMEGAASRELAIVKVMVDFLLETERITVNQGLVYVLDELESCPLEFLATELLKRGANVETKDDYGCTPLMKAVKNDAPRGVIDLLLDRGANVHTVAEDRKTVLHLAAQKGNEFMMRKLIARDLSKSVNAEDKDGWTPLHEAAYYGSEVAAAVLIEKGSTVNARDYRKQTPLHVAAEEGEEEVIAFLLDKKADTNITDVDQNTPLDLAAEKRHTEVVNILLKQSAPSTKDSAVIRTLEKAMASGTGIKDDLFAEKIKQMSRFGVISMLKSEKCGGEGNFRFLHHFAANPELKKSTRAILDHFVVGKTQGLVICEIIDADENGMPPTEDDFNQNSSSLLDIIVETNNKELVQHPAIRAIMNDKWNKFAKDLYSHSLKWYAARMLFFALALLIAARPDLDNPGCYRDVWDALRGICEVVSLLFFIYKLVNEILLMKRLKKLYLIKHKYIQLPAAILPLLIIPFRAATTWCASTGDGYCVDPTLLSNATNLTLDINLACITASNVQWIIASLAYMANAILVIEYLALYRTTGVYLMIIRRIIVEDMIKFTVIFIIALYIFVGSFYLALRAGVIVNMSTGDITSDLEVFRLQTLYPWHVVFTGLRSLIEARGILDGKYFADNEDGQYIGYQWFSIVMYLPFLFAVIVVLLNLLIAQMSDTYGRIQGDVESTFAIERARIIAKALKLNILCFQSLWKNTHKEYVWTDQQMALDEHDELARGKDALLEQKVDQLTKMMAELTRRLQGVEGRGATHGMGAY